MEKRTFFRITNNTTEQGLWYDFKGNFTGLIHNQFDFCKNSKLPMPFDEKIQGWLSATDTLEDLFNWFTEEDIKNLEQHGYLIAIYEATEFKFHQNHWIINQASSVHIKSTTLDSILKEAN